MGWGQLVGEVIIRLSSVYHPLRVWGRYGAVSYKLLTCWLCDGRWKLAYWMPCVPELCLG